MEKVKVENLIKKYKAKYQVELKTANDFATKFRNNPGDTDYRSWKYEHQSNARNFKMILDDLNILLDS